MNSQNPYYTHRKYLIECLDKISNQKNIKILELGIGHGSSKIFHEYALKNKKMQILGIESDYSWFDTMKKEYELPNYKFFHINNWDEFLDRFEFEDHYDIVFVDQTPWEARIKSINALIDKCSFLILHDYDFFNKGVIDNVYDVGENSYFSKYSHFQKEAYFSELPPTLIFKNEK